MNVLHVTSDIGETDVLRREFSAVDPYLRVECAGTPSEAIARLETGTKHYDAVLLELTQMNGEGLSLVSHIRKNHLPLGVVAITSARDDAPAREALNLGADHCVVKGKEFLARLPTVLAHAVERRTLEARLRVMLETAPACLMRVAGDGTILAMNIAALAIVDAERADQVVDQSWYERIVPDAQGVCRDFIQQAANGERGSLERQIEGFSGTRRWVAMHAVCAPADASGVPSALVVIRDLEKTRGLEAGLEAGLENYRQKLGRLEKALSEAEAQNQWLLDGHEAERAGWQQQLAEAMAQKGAIDEQLCAERERLASALNVTEAQQQQLSTDLASERAARKQAELTHQQALLEEQQLNAALERALAVNKTTGQQLTADYEAERAEWQRQLAAATTQTGAIDEQLSAERERLESALKDATAQRRLSTDLASERAARELAEVTHRQALLDEQQLNGALERALAVNKAMRQQLIADHEARGHGSIGASP